MKQDMNISTSLNADFASVLEIIQYHRSRAVQAINHASILTAWHVGAYVSSKIKNAQWGAKVVQQLAEFIHTQDPTLKGWSRRTIYKMVQFYDVYSSAQFVERANSLKLLYAPEKIVPISSAQLDKSIVPPLAAQFEIVQLMPPMAAQIQQFYTPALGRQHKQSSERKR